MFATQNKLEVYQTLPLYAKGRQRQTNSHHRQVVHEFTAVCDDLAKRKNHRPPTEQHITYSQCNMYFWLAVGVFAT